MRIIFALLDFYFFISSGVSNDELQRFKADLEVYSWAFGYGYYSLTETGEKLSNVYFDKDAINTSKIDFIAPVVTFSGDKDQGKKTSIYQEDVTVKLMPPLNEGVFTELMVLDIRTLPSPPLAVREKADSMMAAAKQAIELESRKQFYKYERKHIKILQELDSKITKELAFETVRSRLNLKLKASDYLYFDDLDKPLRVYDVLMDPVRYHEMLLADPLEITYPNSSGSISYGKAKLCFDQEVSISIISFIHGGRRYLLQHDYDSLYSFILRWKWGLEEEDVNLLSTKICKWFATMLVVSEFQKFDQEQLIAHFIATHKNKLGLRVGKGLMQSLISKIGKDINGEQFRSQEQELVEEMNRLWFHTTVGGKSRYCKEIVDHEGNPDIVKYRKQDWIEILDGLKIPVINKDGKEVYKSRADIWASSKHRRIYEGMIFDPMNQWNDGRFFNTFRGLPHLSSYQKGSCEKILWHLKHVVCSGDKVLYDYLLRWIAKPIQVPGFKNGTCPIFSGEEGTGKSILVEMVIAPIYGPYYQMFSHPKHVVGQFNEELETCLFLHLEEADLMDEKNGDSLMKCIITDSRQSIEPKGEKKRMRRNYMNVIIMSNKPFVIPIGTVGRRYIGFSVSEIKMQNEEYFDALRAEINNGGIVAFKNYLLDLDLSDFNPRRLPFSQGTYEMKVGTMKGVQAWWFNALEEGRFMIGEHGETVEWPNKSTVIVKKEDVHKAFCKITRSKMTQLQFTAETKRFIDIPSKAYGYGAGKDRITRQSYVLTNRSKLYVEIKKRLGYRKEWDEKSIVHFKPEDIQ